MISAKEAKARSQFFCECYDPMDKVEISNYILRTAEVAVLVASRNGRLSAEVSVKSEDINDVIDHLTEIGYKASVVDGSLQIRWD